jgi:hypothetical protein
MPLSNSLSCSRKYTSDSSSMHRFGRVHGRPASNLFESPRDIQTCRLHFLRQGLQLCHCCFQTGFGSCTFLRGHHHIVTLVSPKGTQCTDCCVVVSTVHQALVIVFPAHRVGDFRAPRHTCVSLHRFLPVAKHVTIITEIFARCTILTHRGCRGIVTKLTHVKLC